jgi:8-oxo-dGTP diphosphatase
VTRNLTVVCALIERDGCVLAAQRATGQSMAGLWELPGGKVDAGETAEIAIVREIVEELGCTVRPLERLPTRAHAHAEVTITLLPLRCEIVAGEPKALEHAQIRWVARHDLASLDWSAADVAVVADYVKAAGSSAASDFDTTPVSSA